MLLATRLIAAGHRADAASAFQIARPSRHGGTTS
jgi:hypothetical protein